MLWKKTIDGYKYTIETTIINKKNYVEQSIKIGKTYKHNRRARDRKKYLKTECETCHTKKRLTLDHYPPLSITKNTKEYTTLCRKCHDLLETIRELFW